MNLFELTIELIKIPSVSGDEQAVGFFLRDYLESLGWTGFALKVLFDLKLLS